MTTVRTLIALSVATLATACAGPGAVTAPPSSPLPAADRSGQAAQTGTPTSMATMEPRMKAMHEMHHKVMTAKTPEERQMLMADHMKAMQGGMAMMNDMSAMPGMGGMAEGKGMPDDMAKHHQMMAQRMDSIQMMMDMMMQRMPNPAAAGK